MKPSMLPEELEPLKVDPPIVLPIDDIRISVYSIHTKPDGIVEIEYDLVEGTINDYADFQYKVERFINNALKDAINNIEMGYVGNT